MKKLSTIQKINKLLALYKRRIKKDYMTEEEKGGIETYIEEFAKDLKVSLKH